MSEQRYDDKADEALILAGLASDRDAANAYRQLAFGYRALARLYEHYDSDHCAEPIAPAVAHSRSR